MFRSDLAAARKSYADATRSRMDQVIGELANLRRSEASDIRSVLNRLRRQQEASHSAGFENIARLCGDLRQHLAETAPENRPRLAVVAETLRDGCRKIVEHAEAVGKSCPPLPTTGRTDAAAAWPTGAADLGS